MIAFYLLLLLDSLLLQPIRCVLGFAMRFLWHPPRVVSAPSYTFGDLAGIAKERLATLSREIYGQGGDSAKFLGMLFFATDDEAEWRNVMRLVRDDGTARRHLREPYPADEVPFSGDMLAGLFLAVLRRLPKLTGEERAKLGSVWERTTWQGFPLLFANAATGKKEAFGRGHIWRPWWVFGSEDCLTALAWLYMGWKLTGRRKYRIAYAVFMALQLPGLLLACPDAQIWLGRVYGIATYNTHSKALGFYTGWKLTGSRVFKWALAQAYTRHGEYNADIRILAGPVVGGASWLGLAVDLVGGAVRKGEYPCPQDTRYLSLFWPPERVARAGMIYPPELRGGDYIWERNPVKGNQLTDEYRAQKGLDVIFPALLLQRYFQE